MMGAGMDAPVRDVDTGGEMPSAIAGASPGYMFGRPGRTPDALPLMYLSAAISGTDDYRERFASLAALAQAMGHEPLSPLDIPPWEHPDTQPCPVGRPSPYGHSEVCHLRGDLYHMLECDAVLFDPSWRGSWGCRTEMSVASIAGLDIYVVVVTGATREVVKL
jgi:Domain of unknown function (DUF4406)